MILTVLALAVLAFALFVLLLFAVRTGAVSNSHWPSGTALVALLGTPAQAERTDAHMSLAWITVDHRREDWPCVKPNLTPGGPSACDSIEHARLITSLTLAVLFASILNIRV